MKKLLTSLGFAALAAGSGFGYSDSDLDAEGHAYNDPEYYVQLLNPAASGGVSGQKLMYDTTYADHWSSGAIPTAGQKCYAVPSTKAGAVTYWYINEDSTFKANYGNVFAADALVIAPLTEMMLYGNAAGDTAYRLYIHNLVLRPDSRLLGWWDFGNTPSPFSFGCNAKKDGYAEDDVDCVVTLTSEDGEGVQNKIPAKIITGKKNAPYIFHSGFVGEETAVLHLQSFIEWDYTLKEPKYTHEMAASNSNYVAFLGDNENYYGTVRVGSDVKALLGDKGFPNAEVVVDGTNLLLPAMKDDISHSALGMMATSGEPVPVGLLSLTNGATIACAGIVTNGVGFEVTMVYTQEGTVKLDFGDVEPRGTRLTLLSVPADSEIDVSKMEVVNLPTTGCTLKLEEGESTKDLVLLNEELDKYVRLVKDDAYGTSGNRGDDPAKFAYFYDAEAWSDGQAVHAGATYYVPSGMAIFSPISWNVVTKLRSTYGRSNADTMKFMGDELIIGTGGSFTPAAYSTAYNSGTYAPIVSSLTLERGGQFYIGNGSCSICSIFGDTLNVNGTEEDPSLIWNGMWWNNTGNYASLYFAQGLAGSGVLRVGGGAKGEMTDNRPSETNVFYGVNDAFTGTMYAGGFASSRTKYSPVHGHYTLLFGGSGLKNGTLVVDDPDLMLGAFADTATCASIPFHTLQLADGMKLLAGSMSSNNGGFGFVATDSFTQEGSLVVDVQNQTLAQQSVKLLLVKSAAGSIDLSKVSVINNPNEGYELRLTNNGVVQTLELVNPNVQTVINVPDQKTRFVKVVTLDYGQSFDPASYRVDGACEEGGYQFTSSWENGVEVVYLENLMCYDYKQYDVYLATSDYHSTNALGQAVSSFTDGQNWSDKLPPHNDATYSTIDWRALHINVGGEYTFAGRLLNIASQSIPHHETIFRCDPASTINVDDLRFQEGTGFFSSCGNGGVMTFNGKISLYGSVEYPVYFKFNNNVRCIINATIKGGATRFFTTTTVSTPGQRLFTLEFMGDTTGYAGTLQAQTNAVICLGPYGLTNGTVDVASSYSGVASYDSTKPAVVKGLKLAEGATIYATNTVYGLETTLFEQAGTTKLDLGKAPLNGATTINILTVPDAVDLSTSKFSVVTPFAGYSLQVVEENKQRTLVYTSSAPKKLGAVIILK